GTTRGVTLHDVDLGNFRIGGGAIRQLPREHAGFQRALLPGQVTRLSSCLPRARGGERLLDDGPRDRRVLLQVFRELLIYDALDRSLDLAVAELRLRLTLELRLLHLDRENAGEPLPDIVAREAVEPALLEEPRLTRVIVDRAGEGRLEPGEVRPPLVGVDVVDEAERAVVV